MGRPKATDPAQLNLLDWQPAKPLRRFADERVRAGSIAGNVARAVAEALRDAATAGLSREEMARRMSDYLGETVSRHMLDAYASQAREEHIPSVVRFIALLHASGDVRLLQMIAEMFGWAVVPRKFVPLIELANLREQEDELRRQREAILREARRERVL